jgi:hypothetical protein
MATDTGKAGPTDLRKPNRRVESRTVKFAVDSLLEEAGFEPSVPRLLCSGGIKEFAAARLS